MPETALLGDGLLSGQAVGNSASSSRISAAGRSQEPGGAQGLAARSRRWPACACSASRLWRLEVARAGGVDVAAGDDGTRGLPAQAASSRSRRYSGPSSPPAVGSSTRSEPQVEAARSLACAVSAAARARASQHGAGIGQAEQAVALAGEELGQLAQQVEVGADLPEGGQPAERRVALAVAGQQDGPRAAGGEGAGDQAHRIGVHGAGRR